jgi:hypothetical protein
MKASASGRWAPMARPASSLQLQANKNGPDILWLQRMLLADQPSSKHVEFMQAQGRFADRVVVTIGEPL